MLEPRARAKLDDHVSLASANIVRKLLARERPVGEDREREPVGERRRWRVAGHVAATDAWSFANEVLCAPSFSNTKQTRGRCQVRVRTTIRRTRLAPWRRDALLVELDRVATSARPPNGWSTFASLPITSTAAA